VPRSTCVKCMPARILTMMDGRSRWGGGRFPVWGNNRLYYLSLTGDLDAVDLVPGTPSFQSGAPHRLFGGLPPRPWSIDLVKNRFLFLQEEEAIGAPLPFTVVLNWMKRLEQ